MTTLQPCNSLTQLSFQRFVKFVIPFSLEFQKHWSKNKTVLVKEFKSIMTEKLFYFKYYNGRYKNQFRIPGAKLENKIKTFKIPDTYIHTFMHTNTYVHKYVHTYIHTYIHTCLHTYTRRTVACPENWGGGAQSNFPTHDHQNI